MQTSDYYSAVIANTGKQGSIAQCSNLEYAPSNIESRKNLNFMVGKDMWWTEYQTLTKIVGNTQVAE